MSEYIYPELAQHLKERADDKAQDYGTYLKTNNGRHALVDCYPELLDAIVYYYQYTVDKDTVPLTVRDRYHLGYEPHPVDNGGEIVIDGVLEDLRDPSLFNPNVERHYIDEVYSWLIQIADIVRMEIERGKSNHKEGI